MPQIQLHPTATDCHHVQPTTKKTPQTDQWHKPQPLPTRNNHPKNNPTTTHNHCQKSKLAKYHHTNHHQHNRTTIDPRNLATMKPNQTATKKPTEYHEIQPHHQSRIPLPRFYLDRSHGALEFDEGNISGVS